MPTNKTSEVLVVALLALNNCLPCVSEDLRDICLHFALHPGPDVDAEDHSHHGFTFDSDVDVQGIRHGLVR